MNRGERGGEMDEDSKEGKGKEREEEEKVVFMWGYLPGVSPKRTPLLLPAPVRFPESNATGDGWRDVSGGGCLFAMAISESGKLLTWGSTDDMGQSYLTSGKHEETPEAFPLPSEVAIVKAAAGWAHCVAVTASGEVYTWGWKECVPCGRLTGQHSKGGYREKDDKQKGSLSEQVSSATQNCGSSSEIIATSVSRSGEESTKRRRLSSVKERPESSTSSDETLSAPPCLVTFNTAVRITMVAAGGRHTLALSDVGQVWGWGYGGEGQLGLGSRIRLVPSPLPVPCIPLPAHCKDRWPATSRMNKSSDGQEYKVCGTCVKAIACGGRHSSVVTDGGALLTFGWGLYGQLSRIDMYPLVWKRCRNSVLQKCGQGSTTDELSPKCVASLRGIKIHGVAAGLWHTVCTSVNGEVYAFGGNQFGQLGTGADHAETLPKLLDAPSLENKCAKIVSCGARHSAILTEGGEVFCWGWNKYGQLGLGDAIDRNIPTHVLVERHRALNVSCGWWHTLVLAEPSV